MATGLLHHGARAYHFAALMPAIARRTHLLEAPPGRRQVGGVGQGALARHRPRAIDIEDVPLLATAIPQAARLTSPELARHQVLQEQGAQGFDRAVIQTREKARERGAMG